MSAPRFCHPSCDADCVDSRCYVILPADRAAAEIHQGALAELGWSVGRVAVQANGEIGFIVDVPASIPSRSARRRAVEKQRPAGRETRTFLNGTLTVTR